MVAEASGRPWAMYCPFLLMLPSRDAPRLRAGVGAPGRPARPRARHDRCAASWDTGIDRMTMPTLNALRARYGLRGLDHFTDLLRAAAPAAGAHRRGLRVPAQRLAGERAPGRADQLGPAHAPLTSAFSSCSLTSLPPELRIVLAVRARAHRARPPPDLGSPAPSPPPWLAGWRTRSCSSRARPSASTTSAWCASRWRRCRRPACRCSPPRPRTTPTTFDAPAGSRVERFVPHDGRPGARGVRGLPRRHGHHAEGARGRGPGRGGAVRARPAGDRAPRRGGRGRRAPLSPPPHPRAARGRRPHRD